MRFVSAFIAAWLAASTKLSELAQPKFHKALATCSVGFNPTCWHHCKSLSSERLHQLNESRRSNVAMCFQHWCENSHSRTHQPAPALKAQGLECGASASRQGIQLKRCERVRTPAVLRLPIAAAVNASHSCKRVAPTPILQPTICCAGKVRLRLNSAQLQAECRVNPNPRSS